VYEIFSNKTTSTFIVVSLVYVSTIFYKSIVCISCVCKFEAG
jgi:hypothetical protein